MYQKMKWFATAFLIILFLTACHTNNPLPRLPDEKHSELTLEDGIYFVKEERFSDEGWKHTVTLEVTNSEITDIVFDAINESATATKKDSSAREIFALADADALRWDEQIQLLEEFMLINQTVNFTRVIASDILELLPDLTIDIQPFLNLMVLALNQEPIEIGPYRDGFYFALQDEFENGIKEDVSLIVQHGHIIAIHWNGTNEDGTRRFGPLLAEAGLEEDISWRQQAISVEQFLLSTQDPTSITFNADNTTDDIFGVTIEVNTFVELTIRALAAGPLLEEVD